MAQHPMKHLRRDVARFVKIGTVVAVGWARWRWAVGVGESW